MSETAAVEHSRTVNFRIVGGRNFRRTVHPSTRVAEVASRVAGDAGLSGTFQMVDGKGEVLDPVSTTLADLETGETVVLSPELTPATVS
jgi:hypothetical protein